MLMMKHKAIFSLHACRTALSLRPPTELKRTEGAQNVTTREKMTHASKLNDDDSTAVGRDCCREGCGLMRGGGATPRSGRVRVFALRTVPEGPCLVVVVGIGMSLRLKRTAMVKEGRGEKERRVANQGDGKKERN